LPKTHAHTMGVVVFLCLLAGAHAALRGQDITKKIEELRTKTQIAATHLRTFGRGTDLSDPEYVRAQAVLEDLKHRQKLLHYVGLGVMTNAEFEKVAEIQAGLTDIQIRHHFVTKDRAIHTMKLDAQRLGEEWAKIMDPIKDAAHKIQNKEREEWDAKIQSLRERIAASRDREEVALLRLQLEGMYADRPQPTALAIANAKKREKEEAEHRRRRMEREGGDRFVDGRYPSLTAREEDSIIKLRQRLEKATDRDEVRRIRDQMKAIKDDAVERENQEHARIVRESRRREGRERT